jgi:predicted dehydrogenase
MKMTRREFVGAGAWALAGCAAAAQDPAAPPLRIGLVGCGGRGRSAAENCLAAAPNVELVALADVFEERVKKSRRLLMATGHAGVKVDESRCFWGLESYQRMLGTDVDLVLLATPPGFRPIHFAAAVEAGKHVFLEKPAAVDPAGVRKVLEAGARAKAKNLAVVAGTQYRHQKSFIETIRRVHDGAIGDVVAGRIYYHTGTSWSYPRRPGESDMEWQLRNWLYFDWLSGDHIVEQHVHTIDAMCWVMKGPPAGAVASGGRQVRVEPEFGNVYDHFSVDYEFSGGRHVSSYCRQMANTANQVGAWFVGTEGEADIYRGVITGRRPWQFPGSPSIAQAYVQEHADLIASIRAGRPLNETRQVAESTLAAILGRESAYTGAAIRWEEIEKSDLDLSPPSYAFGPLPVRPVPLPGKSR